MFFLSLKCSLNHFIQKEQPLLALISKDEDVKGLVTVWRIGNLNSVRHCRIEVMLNENQRLERQKKSSNDSASGLTCPPIHLHVLPAQSSQVSVPTGSELRNPASQQTVSLDIPGLLDKAVEKYSIWYQLRVGSGPFKENIQKARGVALENCLLKQIHEDQDPEFFVKHGVKAAARRFVRCDPSSIEFVFYEITQLNMNGCIL